MTALLAQQSCANCGNFLVPPILAHIRMEELELDTDYVCLACGCTYRWVGNPPVLMMLRAVLPNAIHQDGSQPSR